MNGCSSQTPNKQMVRDQSHDSLLAEEFEEEAIEIDCGVIDPKLTPDI